jgi:threonine aldolase
LAAAVVDRWPDTAADLATVQTNVVLFPHADPARLMTHLAGHGIRAGTIAPGVVRLMTHVDVDEEGVARAVAALRQAP